jgi:pilus assembly protein CpaB
MNTRRLIVLLLAAVAAGGAALAMRSFLGGGVEKVQASVAPKPVAMVEVLIAARDIAPGQKIDVGMVQWQRWPKDNVGGNVISGGGDLNALVAGRVARTPIVKGEPLSEIKIIKSDAAGFMAASLRPGMRAVSIAVTIASIAGGFIQPNDHVDVLLTRNGGGSDAVSVGLVLTDVRVLAIDQSAQAKDDKPLADARTATLELTPDETQSLAKAQAMGTLSLALRPIAGGEKSGEVKIVHGFPPDLRMSGRN